MDRKTEEWESNAHGPYVEWHKDKGRALLLPSMSEPLHHVDDVCRKAEHALHGSHAAAADIEVICDSWLALDDGMQHEPPHGLRDKKSRAVIAACVIVTCRRQIFRYGHAAPQDAAGIWQSLYWIERYAPIFLSTQFSVDDVVRVNELVRERITTAARKAQRNSVAARNKNSGKDAAKMVYERLSKSREPRPVIIERLTNTGIPRSTAYRWIAEWESPNSSE